MKTHQAGSSILSSLMRTLPEKILRHGAASVPAPATTGTDSAFHNQRQENERHQVVPVFSWHQQKPHSKNHAKRRRTNPCARGDW